MVLSILLAKCKEASQMVLEGPPRWPFALQAMQRVAIEPPLYILFTKWFIKIVRKCNGL